MNNSTTVNPSRNGHIPKEHADLPPPVPRPLSNVGAALEYAALGFSVVPLCHPEHKGSHPPTHANTCTRPGKQPVRKLIPLRENPFTADDLVKIWQRNPALNVGVLTGQASKLVIVDVDSFDAFEAWNAFAGRDNLKTWSFANSKRLPHFCYRWPYGDVPKNYTLHPVHPKLDFLGEDLLSAMPPSRHKNGSLYQWDRGGPGSTVPLLDFPLPLLADMKRTKADETTRGADFAPVIVPADKDMLRAIAYVRQCEPAVSGQGGRQQTFKIACKLVHGFGLNVGDALTVMLEWNGRCQPPWGFDDLLAEIEGAKQRGHAPRIEERHFQPPPPPPPSPSPQKKAPQETLPGRLGSQLVTKKVTFLMTPYVARACLSLVVGMPNSGKSTFLGYLMSLARQTVVLPGFEEDPDLMLLPRLLAHNVPLNTVRILDCGDWAMPYARDKLARIIKADKADLLVVDPVSSYMQEGMSENDPQAVRSVLEAFHTIAVDTGAAVVCVRHPGKDPLNVMRGASAWREVPRNIVELVVDPGPPKRRLIGFYKDMHGGKTPPRYYDLVPTGTGGVRFTLAEETSQASADLAREVPDRVERTRLGQAAEFLRLLLADGAMDVPTILTMAKKHGFSESTMARAREQVGATSRSEGRGPGSKTFWEVTSIEGGGG